MDSGSSASDDVELQYKVAVLGNGAVGKSSLIQRYCEESFGPSYKQTIGLDFYSKKIRLPESKEVTLQIWDIGGQQIGGKMLSNYVQGAHAVCFVYDMTNLTSFKDMEDWYECVVSMFPGDSKPYMVLVGNKSDLPNRQVSAELHEKAMTMHKMDGFLISARSGEKVKALFMKIAAKLSGTTLGNQDLDMADRIVANVASRPEERVAVFHSTQVGGVHQKRKTDSDDCTIM